MVLHYHRSFQQGLSGKYAKVAHRLPPQCSVLEIGCNTGYFSRFLMNHGYEVLGIEKDEEAVKIAKNEGAPVICGDIENPAFVLTFERTFDVVLLMDLLEHLRDPVEVLKRLKTVLNKHGKILITGPNVAYWAVRKNLLFGKWTYSDAGILDRNHLHFYTASSWQALVEQSGYKITVLEPAEGMIPFEHVLYKIPLLGLITQLMRDIALRLLPKLFTIVYLIEGVPDETLQGKLV